MTEVFQPLNDRAAEIITKNADLLEGSAMEPLLLQLVAHVFAYRVIIKRCSLLAASLLLLFACRFRHLSVSAVSTFCLQFGVTVACRTR